MTPLPKRKHSTRRKGKGKMAKQLSRLGLSFCPQCRNLKLPHRACGSCGYYKS